MNIKFVFNFSKSLTSDARAQTRLFRRIAAAIQFIKNNVWQFRMHRTAHSQLFAS